MAKDCAIETHEQGEQLVRRSITVNRPVEEVYRFWRDPENLARHSQHLESVAVNGRQSHWIAKAPAGKNVEWDPEIVEDVPNEIIAWRSLPDSEIANAGSVEFSCEKVVLTT